MEFNLNCTFLVLILICVQRNFVKSQSNELKIGFTEFERVKNDLFSSVGDFQRNTSDSSHDKCISDLGLVGNGLSNNEQWAINCKFRL